MLDEVAQFILHIHCAHLCQLTKLGGHRQYSVAFTDGDEHKASLMNMNIKFTANFRRKLTGLQNSHLSKRCLKRMTVNSPVLYSIAEKEDGISWQQHYLSPVAKHTKDTSSTTRASANKAHSRITRDAVCVSVCAEKISGVVPGGSVFPKCS